MTPGQRPQTVIFVMALCYRYRYRYKVSYRSRKRAYDANTKNCLGSTLRCLLFWLSAVCGLQSAAAGLHKTLFQEKPAAKRIFHVLLCLTMFLLCFAMFCKTPGHDPEVSWTFPGSQVSRQSPGNFIWTFPGALLEIIAKT